MWVYIIQQSTTEGSNATILRRDHKTATPEVWRTGLMLKGDIGMCNFQFVHVLSSLVLVDRQGTVRQWYGHNTDTIQWYTALGTSGCEEAVWIMHNMCFWFWYENNPPSMSCHIQVWIILKRRRNVCKCGCILHNNQPGKDVTQHTILKWQPEALVYRMCNFQFVHAFVCRNINWSKRDKWQSTGRGHAAIRRLVEWV